MGETSNAQVTSTGSAVCRAAGGRSGATGSTGQGAQAATPCRVLAARPLGRSRDVLPITSRSAPSSPATVTITRAGSPAMRMGFRPCAARPRGATRLQQHGARQRVVEQSCDRQGRREPTEAVFDRRYDVQDRQARPERASQICCDRGRPPRCRAAAHGEEHQRVHGRHAPPPILVPPTSDPTGQDASDARPMTVDKVMSVALLLKPG